MDAYHVFKVHKNSFAKNGDNTLQTTMHAGTDHFAYHLVGHDADARSGVAHPSNTSLEGDWRHTIVLGAAFPTHVMQLQPDWLWYLQLSPLGVGQVRIRWDVSVAPEVLADQRDPDAYVGESARPAQHRQFRGSAHRRGRLPRRAAHHLATRPSVVLRTQCVRLRPLHRSLTVRRPRRRLRPGAVASRRRHTGHDESSRDPPGCSCVRC